MIRLLPGCVCHPVSAPAAQTLLCTYTSDDPIVFCNDSQTLPLPSFATSWLKSSIPPNRPKAAVVLTYPGVAGVARAFLIKRVAVTMIPALNNTTHVSF